VLDARIPYSRLAGGSVLDSRILYSRLAGGSQGFTLLNIYWPNHCLLQQLFFIFTDKHKPNMQIYTQTTL
jgi:hypothetical protein